ncbi:MAG TPA: zinc-binding dehydrogenase [Micromonosporaceae bacterium]
MSHTIPATCRAAALTEYGKPLEILDVAIPDRLEPGALLVRTTAATVCATDVHFSAAPIAGGYAAGSLPAIIGHEMTGVVVARGEGADADSLGRPLTNGDRVIWSHGYCGRCEPCVVQREPVLCQSLRGYMRGSAREFPYLTGGFSEYVYVFPTSGRLKVPDEIPDEVAAASSCALRTVVHGFERLGRIAPTDTVAVLGTGPLGLFALAMAKVAGPARLIAVGGPTRRLELAARWGADLVIDVVQTASAADRLALVRQATGGRGADVVIEVSGVPAAFDEGLDLLRRGGRYLIVGQLHAEQVPFNPSKIVTTHATLIGSVSAHIGHYQRGLEFLLRHRDSFDWTEMLTGRYPLEDINIALESMRSWSEIKPVITFPPARTSS